MSGAVSRLIIIHNRYNYPAWSRSPVQKNKYILVSRITLDILTKIFNLERKKKVHCTYYCLRSNWECMKYHIYIYIYIYLKHFNQFKVFFFSRWYVVFVVLYFMMNSKGNKNDWSSKGEQCRYYHQETSLTSSGIFFWQITSRPRLLFSLHPASNHISWQSAEIGSKNASKAKNITYYF